MRTVSITRPSPVPSTYFTNGSTALSWTLRTSSAGTAPAACAAAAAPRLTDDVARTGSPRWTIATIFRASARLTAIASARADGVIACRARGSGADTTANPSSEPASALGFLRESRRDMMTSSRMVRVNPRQLSETASSSPGNVLARPGVAGEETRMTTRLAFLRCGVAGLAIASLVACGDNSRAPGPHLVAKTTQLVQYDSCRALERDIEDMLISEVEAYID